MSTLILDGIRNPSRRRSHADGKEQWGNGVTMDADISRASSGKLAMPYMEPLADGNGDLGSTTKRWSQIFGYSFYANDGVIYKGTTQIPMLRNVTDVAEANYSANKGALHADANSGRLWLKKNGVSNTGWIDIGNGVLLARKEYHPGSVTTYTTTSTTGVDVDSTNLATAQFKPYGYAKLMVVMEAWVRNQTNGQDVYWGFNDTWVDPRQWEIMQSSSAGFRLRFCHVYDAPTTTGTAQAIWKWKVASGTGEMKVGGDYGPGVIQVWGID